MPNNIVTNYSFNALGAIESLSHSKDGGILDQFKYSYDPVGNITKIDKYRVGVEQDKDNGLFRYEYDPLNRLITAMSDTSAKRYTYDALGNRIASRFNGVDTKYEYNARNQLIKTMEGITRTDYSYDKRGNLTNVVENGKQKASYTFDATNMMVGAVTQKGSASYGYDGFRNRISKLESLGQDVAPDPCAEVRYVLDMTLPYDNLLMIKGAEDQSFVWGNSLLTGSGENSFHYLHDHLGSPIRIIGEDSDGATMAYDEFGVPEVMAGNVHGFNNPFGFTGYQMDEVSGLWYAQARYYDPMLGRFGAEDTVRDGLNYYLYCSANPLRFVDLNGLWGKPTHANITQNAGNILNLSGSVTSVLIDFNLETDSGYTLPIPFFGEQAYHFNRNSNPSVSNDSRLDLARAHRNAAIALVNGTGDVRYDLISMDRLWYGVFGQGIGGGVAEIGNEISHEYRTEQRPGRTNYREVDSTTHIRQQALEAAINDPIIGQRVRQALALQHLGRGLHAIQDIQAHGQIGAGPNNITGHAFETLFGNCPDDYGLMWEDDQMINLIPMDYAYQNFHGDPRIQASIRESIAYLTYFMEAIDCSHWMLSASSRCEFDEEPRRR